jgi:hypothetical protein
MFLVRTLCHAGLECWIGSLQSKTKIPLNCKFQLNFRFFDWIAIKKIPLNCKFQLNFRFFDWIAIKNIGLVTTLRDSRIDKFS